MNFITLGDLKEQVRIDWIDEDDALQAKVDAANEYVASFVDDIDPDNIPAPLKQCTLLIAAHWWETRETASETSLTDIPLGADEILLNYRGWAF